MTKHFTVREVAERLGVKIYTVRELIRLGELAAIDVSVQGGPRGKGKRRYRVTEEAMKDFELRRHTQPEATSKTPRRPRRKLPPDYIEYV